MRCEAKPAQETEWTGLPHPLQGIVSLRRSALPHAMQIGGEEEEDGSARSRRRCWMGGRRRS